MTSVINAAFSALLGLGLAVFGLARTVTQFPDSSVFQQLVNDLPTLGTILLFALGVAAIVVGLIVTSVSFRQLRRRLHLLRTMGPRHPRYSGEGYGPGGQEQDWDPAYR